MNDKALPNEGPGREIFIAALRLYSKECERPNLMGDCPFSVDLPQGGRGCGEECLDILESHGPSRPDITFGDSGLGIVRQPKPNSLRKPVRSKAFDAAEVYYRDSASSDVSTWGTCALIYALRDNLKTPPWERTHSVLDLKSYLAELELRGLSAEPLVRNGLAQELRVSISVEVLQVSFVNGDDEPEEVDPLLQAWVSLRDELAVAMDEEPVASVQITVKRPDGDYVNLGSGIAFTLIGGFRSQLIEWVRTALIDDLISWTPPAAALIHNTPVLESEDDEMMNWVVDRFSTTYLDDWKPASLQMEWSYQRGHVSAPFGDDEANFRPVDLGDLAIRVADGTVSPDEKMRQVREIANQGLQLLLEGQRQAAAALFSVFRPRYAVLPDLHNHFGFSSLPDDPGAALDALNEARELGFTQVVNIANRVLALYWLGRAAAALEVAEEVFNTTNTSERAPSYLWEFRVDRKHTSLLNRISPRAYVAELAAHIATSIDEPNLAAKWRKLDWGLLPEAKNSTSENAL